MSMTPATTEVALLAAAAEHQHLPHAGLASAPGELGVGDDPLHVAELRLALDRAVGAHQHRDRAEAAQRGDAPRGRLAASP